VATVCPGLVQYDNAGKPFAVNYRLLNPMLLNEFQKEHRQTEAMKTAFTAQQTEITTMKAAHSAEIAELKASHQANMTALQSELASLKQA